ncbi:hydantoinase B/oxoprolinase family protein, partial [Brevibacterium paucivorans]
MQTEIMALMLMNIRTADKTRGDLMAQVSANKLGSRRVLELIEEWGVQHF